MTLGKKLGMSFGIILVLMSISAIVSYLLIIENKEVQNRVVQLRMKTVLLGKDVINGVNQSLAGLRGYMILGNEPQKAEVMKESRQKAWASIDAAIKDFDMLAASWTVPENIKRLNNLKVELASFKTAQKEIEDISHSENNISSYKVLLTEAAPRANQILANISAIIDEEAQLEATIARKLLLKNLADIRGSFAIGLANIRAYLLSGNDDFKGHFNQKWQVNEARVNTINTSQIELFTKNQKLLWQQLNVLRNEFTLLPPKMFVLRSADDWNKANYWLGTKAAPRASKILSLLDNMRLSQERLLKKDIQSAEDLVQTLQTTLITLTLLSLVVGIVSAVIFSRDLLTRLNAILTRAKSIAQSDMSGEPLAVKRKDELSDLTVAINQMSFSLSDLVKKTADSMVEASSGTAKILMANQEMATGVNKQTSQIETIASAIEELSNSSLEVANNCVTASNSSTSTLELAKSGGKVVQKTLSQMVEIQQAFDNSSQSISTLSVQSKEIASILSVIKGIADQTNLLALNAAIEAARAGEQGRGFAVVADEVRQLAGRTTEATTLVENAIDAMERETDSAVLMMAEGGKKVTLGVDMTSDAATSLNNIIESVDDVVLRIQAIAATAEEQSMTTAEVAQNTESVSAVSHQVEKGISQVVELSSNVTKDVKAKANALLEMV